MKQFEVFRLDAANQCLWRQNIPVPLPPKPFAVLRYLVDNPGRLITHDELLDAVWPETYVQPQVLRTYMLDLRKVLGDDAGQPRFIQTLPKRGYRFIAPVEDSDEHKRLPIEADSAGGLAGSAVEAPGQSSPIAKDNQLESNNSQNRAFFCREPELARLTEGCATLADGQRITIFITGEAGIGKTALLDAFCRQNTLLHQPGGQPFADIGRGQCVEGIAGKEQYYPFMEALGQLCAASRESRACQILARLAPAWLTGLSRDFEAASAPAGLTAPANQQRMPSDLCAAIEELSADRSVILIFEDLQWADDSTLHLISALARRRAPCRLMLIGTYRAKEVAGKHPLRALKQDLFMRQLCTEIALNPLSRGTVNQMLAAALGQSELPAGLDAFVYQHSEGNPLFAISLLEHLIAQQFLVPENNKGVATWEQRAPFQEMEAGVPHGLAQMIELEIEVLDTREQQVLEAGSLMHVAFPAWAVAAALDQDPAEIEEACDALAGRLHFVERAGHDELPDGTKTAFYVFSHGLYREALYERQIASRRAQRHIRIAEKMGESFSGREANVAREMAIHFESAGAWQRAATALRAAAGYAITRNAYAEATQLLEHALRISKNLKEVSDRNQASVELNHQLDIARGAAAEQCFESPALCMKA